MEKEEKVKVEFTLSEIQLLGRLINFAVQARGLEVAEAGVHFARKLGDATAQKGNGAVSQAMTPEKKDTKLSRG